MRKSTKGRTETTGNKLFAFTHDKNHSRGINISVANNLLKKLTLIKMSSVYKFLYTDTMSQSKA